MANKKTSFNYTSRDFDTIKTDLVKYAQRYYPDIYKDFGDASFGSLMLDSVAYVGDVLSFYLDYQANESFLETATEYDNVLKIGNNVGYNNPADGTVGSVGEIDLFVIVPANDTGLGPAAEYMPVLEAGAVITSNGGTSFTLEEDARFDYSKNQVVVARVSDSTGVPTHYAIKTTGTVVSGIIREESISVGSFEKFKKVKLGSNAISEVISVFDDSGNEYFQVDYLSQNVLYKDVANRGTDKDNAPSILKPFIASRRFVIEKSSNSTHLVFGYGSESELTSSSVADPSSIALQRHAKKYVSDEAIDPSKFLSTDKFGIGPSDTTLTVKYRINNSNTVNVSTNSLVNISQKNVSFADRTALIDSKASEVTNSIEVNNPNQIVGSVSLPDTTELKRRMIDSFAAQNRAVTGQDIESATYSMSNKFGSIKRCKVVRDSSSLRRNLNLYVLSEGTDGKLSTASQSLKENLKVWLGKGRMIGDTIDILDGKIVNIGIEFTIVADSSMNNYEVLSDALSTLKNEFSVPLYMGEPLYITDIYNILNKNVPGVVDTKSVKISLKSGTSYSGISFDLESATSADGRFIEVPQNVAIEVKFTNSDIKGMVE
tara:strand:+ start:1422 stop:3224 length:1803 start_codon:yes stop_codon:yes gene_type:complete